MWSAGGKPMVNKHGSYSRALPVHSSSCILLLRLENCYKEAQQHKEYATQKQEYSIIIKDCKFDVCNGEKKSQNKVHSRYCSVITSAICTIFDASLICINKYS